MQTVGDYWRKHPYGPAMSVAAGGVGMAAAREALRTTQQLYNRYRAYKKGPASVSTGTAGGTKGTRARRRPLNKKRQRIRPVKLAKELTRLNNKVTTLSKESKNCHSVLQYYNRSSGRMLGSVAQSKFSYLTASSVANYEAVLAQLRFFNPASPGTLTTADGSTGTYAREYYFKSVYSRIDLVNNYQVPVVVRLYCVTPKSDTSTSPETSFTNGLADCGNPSSTSPCIHPTDSKEFMDTWNIQFSKKIILSPGQGCFGNYSVKDIYYAPQIYDSISLSYQKRFKTFAWCARIEGVLGHDTSANEQSLLGCGVDYVWSTKYVVHYDNGGTPIEFIYINDTSPTSFTNGGVISEKPVADNIGYSVS